MKNFIKYFFLGILGLTLALAFPGFRADYLVIVVGSCWLAAGLWNSLLLSASLALIYSAFSLANPILIFLPLGLGLLSFEYLRKTFSFHPLREGMWLYLHLWVMQWTFGTVAYGLLSHHWDVSLSDILWGLATVGLGNWILPYLKNKFFSLLPTPYSLQPRWRDGLERRRPSYQRNPFGLEKGI